MVDDTLATHALMTLAYTDQFQYPLKFEEIFTRLINTHCTREELRGVLNKLAKQQLISRRDDFYFLPDKEHSVMIRQQRERWSADKMASVTDFVRLIRYIPWIRGVAVTGSLAVNNAVSQSDIDFMIITSTRRLWLVRVMVAVLSLLKGKRRTAAVEKPGSWCFNFWLDERFLRMPGEKRSVYTAYEVCQAKWVYDRRHTQQKFYEVNQWVADHLPHYWQSVIAAAPTSHSTQAPTSRSTPAESYQAAPILHWLAARLFDLINYLAYLAQKIYMLPHITREVVGVGFAFFHPRDTRRLVYTRWRHALHQT